MKIGKTKLLLAAYLARAFRNIYPRRYRSGLIKYRAPTDGSAAYLRCVNLGPVASRSFWDVQIKKTFIMLYVSENGNVLPS